MQISIKDAQSFIEKCIKTKLVPMLQSSPGIGKSDLITQIANKYKLKLIDIRLAQADVTDLSGFPTFSEGIASYAPMNIWPIESTPIPDGYNGWMIFLDEFNSAPPAVQAASYKLVLDRMVGEHTIHPRAVMTCAGNLQTDRAIVNRLSTAMQSRLIHLELMVDHNAWLDWAMVNNIDSRITSYIDHRPDNLFNFNPEHQDKTFANPRTWSFASRLIKECNTAEIKNMLPLLAGTIGEGVANEFVMYTSIYTDLPSFKDIVSKPNAIKIKPEPAMMYALTHLIAANVTNQTIVPVMQFVNKLPIEFQTICLQNTLRKDKTLLTAIPVQEWISEKGEELF